MKISFSLLHDLVKSEENIDVSMKGLLDIDFRKISNDKHLILMSGGNQFSGLFFERYKNISRFLAQFTKLLI